MKHKPLIAVFGATGAQGGGLVRAILDDPDRRFAARAISRHADSEKALALAARGAEVVTGDLDDPALARALNPRLQTFVQWLDDHARRILLDG